MSKYTPFQLPLPLDGETIEILLTKGHVTIVDAVDADLAQYKWSCKEKSTTVYASRAILKEGKKTTCKLHRIILERIIQRVLLSGEVVDHIDGNGLNNRRNNLRLANTQQNNFNRRKENKNTSGYKGVFKRSGSNTWRAGISINNKSIALGSFPSREEAYEAYCKAARELFGEFARFE